jgi:hypothetical protein
MINLSCEQDRFYRENRFTFWPSVLEEIDGFQAKCAASLRSVHPPPPPTLPPKPKTSAVFRAIIRGASVIRANCLVVLSQIEALFF